MVLVCSSHSNKSPHVLTELNEAMSNGIIIIPFRIEDILPSNAMKYLISTPHRLDAMTPPLEEHIGIGGDHQDIDREEEKETKEPIILSLQMCRRALSFRTLVWLLALGREGSVSG